MKVFSLLLVLAVSPRLSDSFTATAPTTSQSCRLSSRFDASATSREENRVSLKDGSPMTRNSFLSWTAATAIVFTGLPAGAKDVDPSLKGTKKDPAYETCVSTCMYDCTKPKGMEQKSRQECLPECKSKCATTKEQLMIGTPTAK